MRSTRLSYARFLKSTAKVRKTRPIASPVFNNTKDELDISAADAHRLGLRDDDRVRICSRHCEVVLPVHLSDTVQPGQLYATFQSDNALLNLVTNPHRDRFVQTPDFKVTAVQLQKL